MSDKRHTIGNKTKQRENLVVRILNGSVVPDSEIAALELNTVVIRNLREQMLLAIPSATTVSLKGKMNQHYDFDVTCAGRGHVEMKITSTKPSDLTTLQWMPWVDTVQFLQGQLKSATGTRILGDCGEMMFKAWYDRVIAREAPDVSYEAYKKIAHAMGTKGKYDAAAVAYINSLRTDKTRQADLQAKWLEFETAWLSEHTLNHAELESTVRATIEDKDWWLCISGSAAHWIEGFNVRSVSFIGRKAKKCGGTTFLYTLCLQKKSGGECKDVSMEFKFHWKNGGQAVQNLNYLLL